MTPLQAAILGLVQGLTEFLPVSSSGHLILVPWLLGWPEPPNKLAFDAAIHLGTMVALIGYFWRDLLGLIGAVLAGLRDRSARADPNWKLAWLILLGSVPAGLIGLLLESTIEQATRQPWLVAALLAAFGLVLLMADRVASRRRGLDKIGPVSALLIGLAQVIALAPGVSRSGITITTGLVLGLDRPAAARFSFLLATPITLAAALFSLRKLVGPGMAVEDLTALSAGVASAAVSGLLAIGFLLRFLQNHSLAAFAYYRLAAALLVLLVYALRTTG